MCDYASVHIPLTEDTRGIIGKKEFSLMREDALFIKPSQGDIVSEIDLLDALDTGKIAGCAFNVIKSEPPSPDRIILNHKKVL